MFDSAKKTNVIACGYERHSALNAIHRGGGKASLCLCFRTDRVGSCAVPCSITTLLPKFSADNLRSSAMCAIG